MATTNPSQERWRPAVGYEGLYEVSDHGRVKSLARVILRNNGRFITVNERILSDKNRGAYHLVVLSAADKSRKSIRAHVLVAAAFLKPPKKGETIVRHKDDNGRNNYYKNLKWGTVQDNADDAIVNDRIRRGEDAGPALLTEKEVLKIKKHLALGKESYSKIAQRFGVGFGAIQGIASGKTWKHLNT
jgi:hypothetical protein